MASSFFLMEVPNCDYGSDGVFIFSDCGMIQNPSDEELVEIGYNSAKSFELLVEKKPNVAFLSHSSYGSSSCEDVFKVQRAVTMAKEKYPDINLDGELQLDAAIVKEIGEAKAPMSPVAGKANVLIFPDLDAGNIGYKLVERLAKAKAYGPVTQGLAKPINDLSRGCNADDVVGVIAITALQAK
jgi:phosphate acetyltransferase